MLSTIYVFEYGVRFLMAVEKELGSTHLNLFDAHAGKKRKPGRHFKTDLSNEPLHDVMGADEYLLQRHRRLLLYPYQEPPELPYNDLVMAIHYFISQECQKEGLSNVFRMYDETALLAIAIEVEEEIKRQLGPRGHLSFASDANSTN